MPGTFRKRKGHQRVSRSGQEDLALLAATSVAAARSDLGPFCPPSQALSAPTTEGRPLDLPLRSEPMRLRSRMREFCKSGYGVHPITGLMGSDWLWGAGEFEGCA